MNEELVLVEVLFVDDNPNDQELMMRAFQKMRFKNQVVMASDGQEALDFLFCEGAYATRNGHDTPKVVFLDIKLPKVNGIDVLRRIRADARTRTLPVVMVTSSGEQRDIMESYNLGVNSYVQKPVDFDAFVKVMAEMGFYWVVVNKTPAPNL